MTSSDSKDIRTPAGFVASLKRKNPAAFAEAVEDLTDADRRQLSTAAQEFFKKIRKTESRDVWFFTPNAIGGMARLGLLAVAPRSAAVTAMHLMNVGETSPRWQIDQSSKFEDAALRILCARRPDWTQEWFEQQLGPANEITISWPLVKALLDDGLCQRPESLEFANFMRGVVLTHNLRQEPDLVDDLWQQFRFNTGFLQSWDELQKNTDEVLDCRKQPYGGGTLLYNLAWHGVISRDRLLEEILATLWRDFSNTVRSTLVKLHDLLEPTDEELVLRQAEYVRLLQNPTPANVTFALKVLKTIRKVDGFDSTAVVEALPAVFEIASKTQPKSALSLLKTLTGKQAGQIESAAAIAVLGLNHAELDVQESSIKLLETWSKTYVPVEQLASVRDLVSLVTRPRLDALIGESPAEANSPRNHAARPVGEGRPDARPAGTDLTEKTAELFARIERLPPDVRNAWKLDESLAAASRGRMIPPVTIEPGRLSGLAEVTPVADIDELIDLIAAAVERIESPIDVERILDGISRFANDFPDNFDDRVKAIRKRFEGDPFSMTPSGIADSGFVLPALSRLIVSWLNRGGEEQPQNLQHFRAPHDPAVRLLNARCDQLRARLCNQKPGVPLLSLPTHEFGWINPVVFVERLRQYIAIDDAPWQFGRFDLRFALLRLAPVEQEAALRQTDDLPDQLRRVVRYALGDDIHPSEQDREWAPEWLSAARGRQADGQLPDLRKLDVPDVAYGRQAAEITIDHDCCTPARMQRQEEANAAAAKERAANAPEPKRITAAAFYSNIKQLFRGVPKQEEARLPVSLSPRENKGFRDPEFIPITLGEQVPRTHHYLWETRLSDWGEEWLASHWPANPEPFLGHGLCRLLESLDDKASSWDPNAARLKSLLRPDRGWSETALHTIWLAIFSRHNDCRAVAMDALVEGSLDGRAHPQALADVLTQLLPFKWLKLNRLADGLKEVARVSPWASLIIADVVDDAIATWETPPRDAHQILAVQLELLLELDSSLSAAARQPLENLKGSSKTAKLAKQLLALTGSRESTKCEAALLEGVAVRISRAEQAYLES